MNTLNGFSAVSGLLVAVLVILVGVGAYTLMNPDVLEAPEVLPTADSRMEKQSMNSTSDNDISIVWRYADAGEAEGIPYTNVFVSINGTEYEVAKVEGSCSEIGEGGGIDGKGLLPGELSATQCWFAGGGYELGVFAHEDGGVDILKGYLSEGEEGAGMFRGDFTMVRTLPF